MKRFVSKITLCPRPPVPVVECDGGFIFEGSFFIITHAPVQMGFLKGDSGSGQIRVTRAFSVILDQKQLDCLAKVCRYLLPDGLAKAVTRDGAFLVPAFRAGESRNEWTATLAWTSTFLHRSALTVYEDHLLKRDKKNQGEKLKEFLFEAKRWIQNLLEFIIGIEEPLPQWIQKTAVCGEGINKKHFVAAYTAVEVVAALMDRVVSVSKKPYFVTGVLFDTDNPGKPRLVLEPVGVRRVQFPKALSRGHMRLCECLGGHSILQQLASRIPSNFKCSKDPDSGIPADKVLMTNVHSGIYSAIIAIEPFVKRLLSDKPAANTSQVSDVVHTRLNYRFTDPKYLKMIVRRDADLEFLGHCVLDLAFGIALADTWQGNEIRELLTFKTSILNDLLLRKFIKIHNLDQSGLCQPSDLFRVFGAILFDGGCDCVIQALKAMLKRSDGKLDEIFDMAAFGSQLRSYLMESLSIASASESWVPELIQIPLTKFCIAIFLYITGNSTAEVAPKLAEFSETATLRSAYESGGLRAAVDCVSTLVSRKNLVDELHDALLRMSSVMGVDVIMKQMIVNGNVMSFFDTKDGHRLPFFGVDNDWLLSQHDLVQKASESEKLSSVVETPARETGPLQYQKMNV